MYNLYFKKDKKGNCNIMLTLLIDSVRALATERQVLSAAGIVGIASADGSYIDMARGGTLPHA